jgi:hypothetical protein
VFRRSVVLAAALAAALTVAAPAPAAPVQHTDAVVNGLKVDRYRWTDSRGRPRTLSLKKEGQGNPGHGGYAVQMTYQIREGGNWRNVIVNAGSGGDGGFGYFVSHERYRDFTDGANDTIAHHVFRKSDSPLGLRLPVVGRRLTTQSPAVAAHRFTLAYPRYGTIARIPKDENGNDVLRTPVDPDELALYSLPVAITWIIQDGTDYPRIRTSIGLTDVAKGDRVNFDIRGPYGVLNFDDGENNLISRVMWGDRFHFRTLGSPLTRNSAWSWNARNRGARYTALVAGAFEMGLVEPRRFGKSALADNWSGARGKTSGTHNGGTGCADPGADQLLPCDWEWPYQSAQYSLPYDDPDGPTTFEKIAWGSSPFYGTGPSMQEAWDTNTTSRPFNGFPASRRIVYDLCVVLGQTVQGGLTRSVAAGPTYNCATGSP